MYMQCTCTLCDHWIYKRFFIKKDDWLKVCIVHWYATVIACLVVARLLLNFLINREIPFGARPQALTNKTLSYSSTISRIQWQLGN